MKQKIRVYPVAIDNEGTPDFSGVFSLGVLLAYVKNHKDGILESYFKFDDIAVIKGSEVTEKIKEFVDYPTVFLCSCYIWNMEKNLEFAKKVKLLCPNSLVVFGGANIPKDAKKCNQLMTRYHCIDVAVRGEGEETLAILLEVLVKEYQKNTASGNIRFLDFSSVKGITFKKENFDLVRNPDRDRITDFSNMPSPYVTGEFDKINKNEFSMAILETNRGCPYGCTFCDWGGATLAKIKKFDIDRIYTDIDYIGENGYFSISIADANFGIFDRDIDIAKKIVETKKCTGFPKKVGLSLAKNITKRYEEIIRVFLDEDMLEYAIASLQTVDTLTLDKINRGNIKESAYLEMINIFHSLGVEVSTDLLIGLPGQTYQSFTSDLQFCFDKLISPRVARVCVLVNSPMAEDSYMKKNKIEVTEDNTVKSTYSCSEFEIEQIMKLYLIYAFFIQENILAYYLYYLQAEKNVKALDFLEKWRIAALDEESYPLSYWIMTNILNESYYMGAITLKWGKNAEIIFSEMENFYQEIIRMTKNIFSVELDFSEVDGLIEFQTFLMPKVNRDLPFSQDFSYDMQAYFNQFYLMGNVGGGNFRSLSEFENNISICVPSEGNKKRRFFSYTRTKHSGSGWSYKLESNRQNLATTNSIV